MKLFEKEIVRIKQWRGPQISGRVTHVIGTLIESLGPRVTVGEICFIYGKEKEAIACQVVGFKDQKVLLMPFTDVASIPPGAEVYPTGEISQVGVSQNLMGRVLDAKGAPLDGKGKWVPDHFYPILSTPPLAFDRKPIAQPLYTGIKAIDALCTLGRGQRIGIFSSPGVGKSTLLGMIARASQADVNIIALIGERGREVREFIEYELGAKGLSRSVVVVATSDQAPLMRARGALVAMAIAEYFRDLGKNVVFLMDSVSRYAMALREIGLAIGEPPAMKGYTPSVFAQLPRLLERAGNNAKGSITGIYTILSEEGEIHDPIPDQVRSLLDGHLQLSQTLAIGQHFPPIDILKSLSRVMPRLVSEKQLKLATKLRNLLHAYKEKEDLILLGAYVTGSHSNIDEAIAKLEGMNTFLKQTPHESFSHEETLLQLEQAL